MDTLHRSIVTLVFLASGMAKLLALGFEVEAFARWGYPEGFMYFTGVLEVAGAVGIWIDKLKTLAAAGLAGLMLGAVGTHAVFGEWPMLLVASLVFAITASYAWRHRSDFFSTDSDDSTDPH